VSTNILWTGREYYSLENCLISETGQGNKIESTIVGKYEDTLYQVKYVIQTKHNWQVTSVRVETQLNGKQETHSYESLGECTDVDIPLTPFTNTLPIRRLNMKIGETHFIKVLYLDILTNEFKPVRQKYQRLSEFEYKYENVPNDFEAVITVDQHGFVVDYPQLFTRTFLVEV